jgi:RNA polymerase sigma-70 factor, ECF subfamily
MTIERDDAWFDALYRRWHGQVLAYARRRVAEPDDLVSEVFTAAWRHRAKVSDPPLPWLLRTASNLSMHAARGDRRRSRLHTKISYGPLGQGADPDPDHAVALQTLSAVDRELLRLVAWEQLSTPELAFVLTCSEAAVRVRLHRARGRLARAVSRLEHQESPNVHPAATEVTT